MSLSIDHIVLTVNDINKTIIFYSKIIGMDLKEFYSDFDQTYRKSLIFGNQKINLHDVSSPFKPHANYPSPGGFDICFLSDLEYPKHMFCCTFHLVLLGTTFLYFQYLQGSLALLWPDFLRNEP